MAQLKACFCVFSETEQHGKRTAEDSVTTEGQGEAGQDEETTGA